MCRMGSGKLQDVCMGEGERSLAMCLCGGESALGMQELFSVQLRSILVSVVARRPIS